MFCTLIVGNSSGQHTATPIKNGKMNQGADSTVRKRVQHGWYAKLEAKHDTSLRAVDRPVRKRVRPQENTHDTATNSQLLAEMTAAIPKKLKISNQKAISATQPKNGNNVATYEGHPLADNLSRWVQAHAINKSTFIFDRFRSLWCHCRRKHMMQYMIECDRCKIFYHGNCVGMSMSLEAEMHKKKRKWICASCISIWNEYVYVCFITWYFVMFMFMFNSILICIYYCIEQKHLHVWNSSHRFNHWMREVQTILSWRVYGYHRRRLQTNPKQWSAMALSRMLWQARTSIQMIQ